MFTRNHMYSKRMSYKQKKIIIRNKRNEFQNQTNIPKFYEKKIV